MEHRGIASEPSSTVIRPQRALLEATSKGNGGCHTQPSGIPGVYSGMARLSPSDLESLWKRISMEHSRCVSVVVIKELVLMAARLIPRK